MTSPRITKLEWTRLQGIRPRGAGCNARLGAHGLVTHTPMLRITSSDGSSGIGICHADQSALSRLLEVGLSEVFDYESGVPDQLLAFDYPIWDLMCKRAEQPVYAVAARINGLPPITDLRVPCYDTSLYMDDLHLEHDADACDVMAAEALAGIDRGHRAFKMKIGRGARHMPLEAGTRRDIAVIRAVRQAIGADAQLMLDANNGYNLNLACRVLEHTADCAIYWLEEPFHEDPVLYTELQAWLKLLKLPIMIADGEGEASAHLLEWAAQGLINVVQYDYLGHGFTRWLRTGQQLDKLGIHSAPHHYGNHYGNYAACHMASAIKRFAAVEWDESTTPGLDGRQFTINAGYVHIPAKPGFGVDLDEKFFLQMVASNGFTLGHA